MIWLFIKPKTKANLQFHILKFANFSVWIFISAKQSVPQVTIAYSYNISWPQRMKLRWNCRSFKKVGNLFRRGNFHFFFLRGREASIGWKLKIVRNNWRSHFATIFPLCYWRKKQSFVCSLFGFIWSNREKIGKSLGTCEWFCPIFISCSWQCHLKFHSFALAIKLLNHNRQENNGSFSFCFHLPRFVRKIGTFQEERQHETHSRTILR